MTGLVKALIGLGSVGAISTGGYFLVNNLASPKNVGEFLVKKGFRLLDLAPIPTEALNSSSDYEEWVKKLTNHKESASENKFSGITDNDVSVENLNKFKNECKKVLEMPLSNGAELEVNKKKAVEWCAVNS